MGLTRRRKRRNHDCPATVAAERNKKSLSSEQLIRKEHSWGHQVAIASNGFAFVEGFTGNSFKKGGAGTTSWIDGQELLKCYSRRKFRQLRVPAAAPSPPEEVCDETACQGNVCKENVQKDTFRGEFFEDFGQYDCEEHPELPPSSKTPTLRGLRSVRRRRDKPLKSFPQILKEVIKEDCRKNDTPPDSQIGRPQRRKRENPKYLKDCFRIADTAEYDCDNFYPEMPFDHAYLQGCGMQLGEVESISNSEGGNSSDILAHVEEPVPLTYQLRNSRPRQARKSLGDRPFFATKTPNVVHEQQLKSAMPLQLPEPDEVFACSKTVDTLPESHGKCAINRNPSLQNESPFYWDSCWTPSKCDVARDMHTRLQVSRPRRRVHDGTQPHLVVKLSGSPTTKSVKGKKKRIRPRVKQPKKVKTPKSPKILKISKASGRSNAFLKGTLERNDATSNYEEAKALRKPLQTNERAFSRSPVDFTLMTMTEDPNVDIPVDKTPDNYYTNYEGEFRTHWEMVNASEGTFSRHECRVDIQNFAAHHATAQMGESYLELKYKLISEIATEEIPAGSDDQQPLRCPVIRCIHNFGDVPVPSGSWMNENPPSTPRANALIVHQANVLNSPPIASEEESYEKSLDYEDEQTCPCLKRRKGPVLRRRIRRALVPAVESELNDLAPLCSAATVTSPHFSSFEMSGTHKMQHALAVSRDQQDSEDPPGLVKKLTTGTPKHLLQAETCKLMNDVAEKILVSKDTPTQRVYSRRRRSVHFPQPLNSKEFCAEDELQLVVYGQKSNEMVSYRGMRPKVKCTPKVFLDEVTIKTFNRLLLQGGEASDADRNDQNWAEQRLLWGGRAHNFNAVMRDVQGDRTFSKWGGSVLDSVVGVFLTQNVSDFLSSNAFMELCAHFPLRRDNATETCLTSKDRSPLSKEMSRKCPAETPEPYLSALPKAEVRAGGLSAGLDELQQEAGGNQDDRGQLIAEVCMTETLDTPLKDPWEARDILVDLSRRDDGQRGLDVSDPYSFSDGYGDFEALSRSIVVNDIAIALETVNIQSSAVPEGCCSFVEMANTNLSAPGGHVTDDADNASQSLATKIVSELHAANRVRRSICTEPETQGSTQEESYFSPTSEQGCLVGNDGDFDTGKKISSYSVLQDKFKLSLEGGLTSDRSKKFLATALAHILGKSIVDCESAIVKEQFKIEKRIKLKSGKTSGHISKISVKELTGGQRATYEYGFNYKLNAEMKTAWEALRTEVLSDNSENNFSMSDSVDWEAVRLADVAVVADLIKERGMNNILSGRIKSLLDRIYRDQDGSLDLEWIRKLSPIDSQKFLINVRGLGIKSVECIRLLSLHHPSFPVDTNVGRILVRLGWVPLEPLPEEIRLHLLEMYPVQEQIQKYIWPRLCTLDQQTLYEFHYQLITFGKVFCTKSKPNCSACPMRVQCKHFESAVSSSRPLVQGSEKVYNHSMQPLVPLIPKLSMQHVEDTPGLLTSGEANGPFRGACIPFIEEPCSPVPDYVQDIEDGGFVTNNNSFLLQDLNCNAKLSTEVVAVSRFCGDGVYMQLNLNDTYTQNLCLEEENEAIVDVDDNEEICRKRVALKAASLEAEITITEESVSQSLGQELALCASQELVLLPPYAASFPAPLLKRVQRLRTVHYVYELPDHHPLLQQAKMDKRDSDDPCLYLLAIWNADEVPVAMPKISDDDVGNSFASCNSGLEVPGTILVPCRTANKGSFPLNGTYFQVNEVFADHASSHDPLRVSRTLMWNLNRKFVYFGTSVTSIFKDMSQGEIQCCFKKGYVCVRGFDQATRKPKPLAPRLHQSTAKIVAARAQSQRTRRRTST